MNIPKQKAQSFMSQSNEKKWQLVCSQNVSPAGKHPPGYYLDALISHSAAIEKQRKKVLNDWLAQRCR